MENFYKSLLNMYELLTTESSIEDLMYYVYKHFNKFIPYDRIGIALLGNDNLYSFAAYSDYEQQLKKGYSLGLSKTSIASILSDKEPKIIDDYYTFIQNNPGSQAARLLAAEDIKSSIAYPLITNNISIGIVIFSSKNSKAYNLDQTEIIKAIANGIAIAIEKYQLVNDLILASITGFAKLVEAKDSDTGMHLERMQSYSRIIAKGLSEEPKYKGIINSKFIDDIFKFSPLHDIGKVGIADGILLKPAKLTYEEFEVMKMHTIIGADVLRKASESINNKDRHFFDMGLEITLGHHERYDGKGYPHGLSSEDIPLSARIVMAADVLDALTSRRVYKEAIDFDTSFRMIQEESGKMFDPDIVNALFKCKAEIIEVYNMHKETLEWSR